jgi:hypothetical protein
MKILRVVADGESYTVYHSNGKSTTSFYGEEEPYIPLMAVEMYETPVPKQSCINFQEEVVKLFKKIVYHDGKREKISKFKYRDVRHADKYTHLYCDPSQ